jgi:hypothetical protein
LLLAGKVFRVFRSLHEAQVRFIITALLPFSGWVMAADNAVRFLRENLRINLLHPQK